RPQAYRVISVLPDRARRSARASRFAFLLHAVPPGADAGIELVIAFDDLHGLPQPDLRALDAKLARLRELLGGEPLAVMTPEARPKRPLERLPRVVVDRLAAPAVFEHEAGRIPPVERGHVVAGMAAERDRDALLVTECEVVALADVVEAEQLDH